MQNKQDNKVASVGALSALGLDVDASEDRKATQVDSIKQAAQEEHDSMREAVEEAEAQLADAGQVNAQVADKANDIAAKESSQAVVKEDRAAAYADADTDAGSATSSAASTTAKNKQDAATSADAATATSSRKKPAKVTASPATASPATPAPAPTNAASTQTPSTTPNTNKLGKRTILSIVVTCVCIPAVVALGLLLGDVNFYITSVVIIFLMMFPFFVRFEGRNPQARELVVIAVMTAIAAASRAAFVWLPSFSPLIGIAIITAIALGPEQGFITGALAAFVSNFLFGQGPWTPWQMFAYGIGAFIAGILVKKGILKPTRVPLTIFGFLIIVLFVGPILDTCTVFVITPGTFESALSIYLAGFVYNIGHGLATAITLALVSKPLCEKIERIRVKYGMAEA